MTKEELITQQQLQIEDMKEHIKSYQEDFNTIYMMLYAIGAPLNDNVLGFNKEQLGWFFRLANLVKGNINSEDNSD